jgi:hypothetical protein
MSRWRSCWVDQQLLLYLGKLSSHGQPKLIDLAV